MSHPYYKQSFEMSPIFQIYICEKNTAQKCPNITILVSRSVSNGVTHDAGHGVGHEVGHRIHYGLSWGRS